MSNTLLQTCPYITAVLPDSPSPVIYLTDPLDPDYPKLDDAPESAKFGIIDLDRTVTWREDKDELRVLESCALEPQRESKIVGRFGRNVVEDMKKMGWLKKEDDLCKDYYCRSVQIETTTHCNRSCRFCPVFIDPKTPSVMPMEMFTEIVEKAAVHKSIRFATFHFFNEPTLDPQFIERAEVLKDHGMKLALYTNASLLDKEKIEKLEVMDVIHVIWVNFPSLDRKEFMSLTQSDSFDMSIENIELLSKSGLPVKIAVNGTGKESFEKAEEMKKNYASSGIEVIHTDTCDRAGALEDTEYAQDIHITSRLTGCSWPVNHPYFSVNGDIFLCCNDYYQKEKFGNIKDGSLHEIMTSDEAVEMRRKVFGVSDSPDDFICRSCHDQTRDFSGRQFRPLASFPLLNSQDQKE